MQKSKIEWTDMTWNPISGCLHGCEYCYARKIANRFGMSFAPKLGDIGMEGACKYDSPEGIDTMLELNKPYYKGGRIQPYPAAFLPTFHRYRLNEPAKVKKPQKIFVCSMADLFGDWVPDSWIEEVFKACEAAPQHTYMFLTKNPKRYSKFADYIRSNWCIGATITVIDDKEKIKDLLEPYTLGEKFLSIEPLLNDIGTIQLDRGIMHRWIDWVIVGQQTGPGAIPPKDEWVQSIIDQCKAAGVPIFVKHPLYEKFPIQQWPEVLK